jgi:predicted enzyme related to lactoylglutathione lyase
MNVSRFIVFTPDVKRLADFYASAFDLSLIGDADKEWIELSAGTCSIAFHKTEELGTTRDGWTKIVFYSNNVDSEKKRLEEMGLEMSNVVSFGEIRLCDGRDPDGNYFQISSRGK